MDTSSSGRAAKLALARQKLKDHQVKKTLGTPPNNENTEELVRESQTFANYQDSKESINADPVPFDPAQITVIESDEILPKTEINLPEPLHSNEYHQMYQNDMNSQQYAPSTTHHNLFVETAPLSYNTFSQIETVNNQLQQNLTTQHHFVPQFPSNIEPNVNVTEMLISNKRNLENQISELQTKLAQIENSQSAAVNENYYYKQQINNLQQDIQNLQQKCSKAHEEIQAKDATIKEFEKLKSTLTDENNNLQEQLEFTKTILTTKESENASLQNQLNNLQNQLDVTQLHLQQVTNGNQINIIQQQKKEHDTEILLQKIASLEHQLKTMQKERDQLNVHYEQYVGELNEQLNTLSFKNEELNNEVTRLTDRENGLIEQISDMEIRLQNFQIIAKKQPFVDQQPVHDELQELQQKYASLQANYEQLSVKYDEIQKLYAQSEEKIKELKQALEEAAATQQPECTHDNISISKLNADITSDKIAAQRASEQNKKLKIDLEELEKAFVKISQDKLELVEKLTAEKFLNRELTIKLAESEEKVKDLHTKLMAKDGEMIRLQSSYREIEKDITKIRKLSQVSDNGAQGDIQRNGDTNERVPEEATEAIDACNNNTEEHHCLLHAKEENTSKIPKEDAMMKLQERFLKIMGEVADLSDEKHRLEHIILQLQNETDTICEYVALYQQQRSLLKKRDEERSAQIKIFQTECQQLKNQLEELSGIIIRLAKDTELAVYFQSEPRQSDLAKVMNLLANLRNSSLVDPKRTSAELKDFYPCSCCSGQLIDV